MAFVKGWILEAAEEIYHGGEHGEHLDTSPEVIGSVIAKHAPFKDGVAYMPVPRCEACAHWTFRPEYLEPHGACTADKIGSDCGDYTIIVPADFGCIQWEKQ